MGMADMGDGLGIAARKHLALQLRPVHQAVGGLADRLQPAQPVGERGRHLLGARTFGRRRLRQQQPRFQKGEPGRHHEIVGGELQPDLSRRLDEPQILVGQRQDRNFGQVDLLLPRQREQQVERAFIALDVDDQRRLALGKLGRPAGLE